MAAPWTRFGWRALWKTLRPNLNHLALRKHHFFPNKSRKTLSGHVANIYPIIVLGAVGFTTTPPDNSSASSAEMNTDDVRNFEPNDPRLRSHECLKNAAGLSVDSTSAVLSQTVYALTQIEKQYVELVDVLVVLMEYQLQVLGHPSEEERIGGIIVETRYEIDKVRRRKEDLQLLFASVEKLADATAEVAFAAGADYASTSAGERLYSAQQEVKRVQEKSRAVEMRLHEAQARSVEVMTKHEEKNKAEEAQQQEETHISEDHTLSESFDNTSSDDVDGNEQSQTNNPYFAENADKNADDIETMNSLFDEDASKESEETLL